MIDLVLPILMLVFFVVLPLGLALYHTNKYEKYDEVIRKLKGLDRTDSPGPL